MSEWYSKIESTVFTQLKYMLKTRSGAPYPSLNCKTTSESITPAKFPTLYLHETQEETGRDLTNETVNAVISTITVRVWTEGTEQECKEMLASVVEQLKNFRYNIQTLPSTQISSKVSYGQVMARRVIGNSDGDIVK